MIDKGNKHYRAKICKKSNSESFHPFLASHQAATTSGRKSEEKSENFVICES